MLVSELENRADKMIRRTRIPNRIETSKEFNFFQKCCEWIKIIPYSIVKLTV